MLCAVSWKPGRPAYLRAGIAQFRTILRVPRGSGVLYTVCKYTLLAKKTTVRFHSKMFSKPDVMSLSQGLFLFS